MANEVEIIDNPTSTPAAVSTGYQRQNTCLVSQRAGLDLTVLDGGVGQVTLQISGPVDVNGVLYDCKQATVLSPGSGVDRYYIYLDGSGDNLTPTLTTNPGTFDASKNARYTAGGYRILNWIIDYDGTDCEVKRWLNPNNVTGFLDIPVGVILAWVPGYFGDGSNGSYTGVSIQLNENWKECDGSALNDSDSPIFNAASRYLPNLTDDRFLMGDTAAGATGGDNDSLAHTHNVPSHYHGKGNISIGASGSHTHSVGIYTGLSNGNTSAKGTSNAANDSVNTGSETHTHANGDFSGSVGDTGGSNGDSAFSSAAVNESRTDKNIPKYLSCKYIIKVK